MKKMNYKTRKLVLSLVSLLLLFLFVLLRDAVFNPVPSVDAVQSADTVELHSTVSEQEAATVNEVPALDISDLVFEDTPYAVINDNTPFFSLEELSAATEFEEYSELDALGRCGVAYCNVSVSTMPTESRGEIGSVKPSGWHSVKYDCVDGKYLYNRCHLIGFQLAGENANEKNLVTGTRYMNFDGMLPFENMVADYVRETGNHVLYRVTPYFLGDDLVCRGVLIEAMSVEDAGDGILFNVFCFNAQPGVVIDYATGDSWLDSELAA